MVFLSATVTKATVSNTGTVTNRTSIIEINVGIYNILKLKKSIKIRKRNNLSKKRKSSKKVCLFLSLLNLN
jgi:hypothetical protein